MDVRTIRTQRAVLACSLLAFAVVGCGREPLPPPPPAIASQPTVQREAVQPSSPTPPPLFVQAVAGEPILIGHVLPLTDAISNLQTSRVKVLLEGGADPNVREEDATSWPPLALAMRGEAISTSEPEYNARREMMGLLLAHGADPNIRWCETDRPQCNEKTGVTPLMYAATLGYEEFTDILVKHGADQSLRDWQGLTASDYWGVKTRRPSSWCLAPILKKAPGPYAQDPILADAHWLMDPKYLEQPADGIREALNSNTDRSVEIVKEQGVCEAAAVAYARYRMMDQTEPKPRPVVPVAVVRAGPLWIADDQADGGGRGIFDRSWRILAWFEPPD